MKKIPAFAFRIAILLPFFGSWGCDHSEPFVPEELPQRGPRPPEAGNQLLTRLTFNPGDDRTPSVFDSTIVFSRLEPTRGDGDRCIAFLPLIGGTIFRMECPNGNLVDDTRDAWVSPTVSPTGEQIAWVWEKSPARFNSTQPNERTLRVAPIDTMSATRQLDIGGIRLATGVINDFRSLKWVQNDVLRFVAGIGGFNFLTRDTIFEPVGVFDWNVSSGAITSVPGTGDVFAFTIAPDRGMWYLNVNDSSSIYHLPQASVTSTALPFDWSTLSPITPGIMWDISALDGRPLVAAKIIFDSFLVFENRVYLLNLGSASAETLSGGVRTRHVIGVQGRNLLIAEIEQGTGSNLFALKR